MSDPFEQLLASLPMPGRDEKPPAAKMSDKDRVYAVQAKKISSALLDPHKDTEVFVKRALQSVTGMKLKKDGDYETIAGGMRVWVKKVADYVGSTPGLGVPNYHTYVEVKGISPGKTFYFGRLDKPNKEGEPSQHEKLSAARADGNLVFLALGWWKAWKGAKHTTVKRGKNDVVRWYKDTLELQITLIEWDRWVEFYEGSKRRSLTHIAMRNHFEDCMILKTSNRWHLPPYHWWNDGIERRS